MGCGWGGLRLSLDSEAVGVDGEWDASLEE